MFYASAVILAFVVVVRAVVLPEQYQQLAEDQQAVVHHAPHQKYEPDHDAYDAHPKYSFAYDVHDQLTDDNKSQTESRDGDVVQGEYTVHDPDGFLRTVKYTVDPHSGFQAVVHRQPLEHKSHHNSLQHHSN